MKAFMLRQPIAQFRRLNPIRLKGILFVAAFAIVGSVLLFATRAAGPFASLEPEQGSKTSPAIQISDATASAGQAVQFGNTGSGGGACPAFPQFPNKTCTGVPAGTALTDYGNVTITQDNTVIQNVRITGRVTVRANNVTFRNCHINVGPIAIGVDQGFNGLTLENCTIIGGSISPPFSGLTLRRVLIDGGQRVDGLVIGFSGIGHNGQNILITPPQFPERKLVGWSTSPHLRGRLATS